MEILKLIKIAPLLLVISGCVTELPHKYYAPSASTGQRLGGVDCPVLLDWIQLSEGGATLNVLGFWSSDRFEVNLIVNEFNPHAPKVQIDLDKTYITDTQMTVSYHPTVTEQFDFRRKPIRWLIEPHLNVTEGAYYMSYPGPELRIFVLHFPSIRVEENTVSFPDVTFTKHFGIPCGSKP